MSFYRRLTFRLPEAEVDWFSLELFARGADGVSTEEMAMEMAGEPAEPVDGELRLVAYCPDPLPAGLEEAGDSWADRGIRRLDDERCASRDWLAAWRASAVPTRIGRGFVIDPREPEEIDELATVEEGRTLLLVPARRAFGTGSHPSTRLVLEWMEDLPLEGCRVLDVGTGTAILSMAALELGASQAIGIDVDPVACFVASETLALNRSGVQLVAGGLTCLAIGEFDCALVNILPSEWIDEAAALTPLLAAGGKVVLSGIPIETVDEVVETLAGAGLEVIERRGEAEWAALLARRSG